MLNKGLSGYGDVQINKGCMQVLWTWKTRQGSCIGGTKMCDTNGKLLNCIKGMYVNGLAGLRAKNV